MSVHECSICLDNLSDPRILKCGHSFCKGCLSQLKQASTRRSIACPDCRVLTDVPRGVDALPINWAVRKAQEVRSPLSAASSSSAPQSSSIDPLCAKHNVAAILFCKRCVTLFCSKCLVDHSPHIDDVGPVEDSVSVFMDSLLKESTRVSDSIADCDTKINCLLDLQRRADARSHAHQEFLKDQIIEFTGLFMDKVHEIVKKLDAQKSDTNSKIQALQTHRPSLSRLDTMISDLIESTQQSESGDLDWPALKAVIENSKQCHREAPASSQPSGIKIKVVDKKEIIELFRQIASQIEKIPIKTVIMLPLPFELPFEVNMPFSCTLSKYRRGDSANWGSRTLGPLKWKPLLCPAGVSRSGDSGVSFYLKLSPAEKVEGWHIRVKFKLCIENRQASKSIEKRTITRMGQVNQVNKTYCGKNANQPFCSLITGFHLKNWIDLEMSCIFKHDSKAFGWSNVVLASQLSRPLNGFILDGKLKFTVSFHVINYWAEPGS